MVKFKQKTINQIADLICGNASEDTSHFVYRSSSYLSEFFEDCDTDYAHDGSTRKWWVAGVLDEILKEPPSDPNTPPDLFLNVIQVLMDQSDALNESPDRSAALTELNAILSREGLEAFYAEDRQCYLRHTATGVVAKPISQPHRPLSREEIERRELLSSYLDQASEDALTEELLLPLFRQLGFQRVTLAGHKDKALEYGKDIWMKYRLPTGHSIYFGVQVKRGKLDASGRSKNQNIAEALNQILMMLDHMVFDPETNKKSLVDHAIIVAGGDITKQAKNWLGEKLSSSQRSQILFTDRNDLLDLLVVNNTPLPESLLNKHSYEFDDAIPF